MADYIVSLDQGTTSSRAIVFAADGAVVASAQKEFAQHYPQPGWVEHDPAEIWYTQAGVFTEALSKAEISAADIAAIGITNQRETTIVWEKKTGKPICNAIVWQDRRTAEICNELKAKGYEERIREKTGLVVDAYFSGTKIKWILDNIPGARRRAEAGELACGTVDSWLVWNLTGGALHITDLSNASRTMLVDIHLGKWDEELLSFLDIPGSLLPEIRSSSELYAHTSPKLFPVGIPIAGIAGDQQAALFGQVCTKAGMVKNTYGTGCFMLMNTGERAVASPNNLLATVAWRVAGKTIYALEGSVFIGGAVVQWLRDGLGIIKQAADVEALARSVKGTDGVYLVPAFAGLGAPHWDPYARGIIVGITRGTSAGQIALASLQSIALQSHDVLERMVADSGVAVAELRVDGGATSNDLLMQFQADILGVPVVKPVVTETTALGAAYLAGLAVGFWHSAEEIAKGVAIARRFEPVMSRDEAQAIIYDWRRAIDRSKGWAR